MPVAQARAVLSAATPAAPLPTRPQGAILWVVENCNDAGPGSLRNAAQHANDGDGIDLSALTCSTISVTSGAINLPDVILTGPGADVLSIDGINNENHRIFNHSSSGGTLTIKDLTISRGKYTSNQGLGGGCLRSSGGNVVLENTKFSSCGVVTPLGANGNARGGAIAAYGSGYLEMHEVMITGSFARTDHGVAYGGAVYAQGHLQILASTISNNNTSASGVGATVAGGGLFTRSSAWIDSSTIDGNTSAGAGGGGVFEHGGHLTNSTVSNNDAIDGASAIAFLGGASATTTIANSTISGNTTERSAQGASGALFVNTYEAAIYDSTITANDETNGLGTRYGAGIVIGSGIGNFALHNSIVSGNYFHDDVTPSLAADIVGPSFLDVSASTNLIGWSSITIPPPTIWTTDPLLGPLQDNGGWTPTHMPLPGSPAIDHGFSLPRRWDQRSQRREAGTAADIGAVETGTTVIFRDDFDMGS